jgi:hypothetical protein
MSEVIGDTRELHQNTINFNAVHTVSGASGFGHFRLETCSGLQHLLNARASVRIVSSSLTCQVIGPVSAAKAVSAHIAVIPSNATAWPTTAAQILTIGGSAFVQHSLYVGAPTAPLQFSQEAAHQLKPSPVLGSAPEIVFQYTITGGTDADSAYLRISGVLAVDGIGFVTPW